MKADHRIRVPAHQPSLAAFSLIELLVAMTVLILLIVLVVQLTNSALMMTGLSERRLDADEQARVVFSRMAEDFAGMLNREDIDCFFVKNYGGEGGHSDAFYLYSKSAGYFQSSDGSDLSTTSLVGYRIANHGFASDPDQKVYPDNMLERVGRGLCYLSQNSSARRYGQVTYLIYSGTTLCEDSTIPVNHQPYLGKETWDGDSLSSTDLANSATVLADSVFRMEFCFQVKKPSNYGGNAFVVPVTPGTAPGQNVNFSGTSTSQTSSLSGVPCVTMRQIYSDIAAVVVTIAVIDPKSRVVVTSSMMSKAASALSDGDTPDVASTWQSTINSGDFKTASGLPALAASQVRIYQRFFYLNSN
ncbi:MAG: type II secretion system protein J [Chthoniobacteraceae bacterium]